MRIWIDLANSPHPLILEPVAGRLTSLGHEVVLTARDNAQTVELASQRWTGVEVIGGPTPRGRRAKVAGIAARIAALRRWARHTRPDVALSHNSYAQVVAARSLGIPAVTAMDYEHQPANHLAFRCARTILLPAPLPRELVARQGASAKKVEHYDGLKEELYLAYRPVDEQLRDRLLAPGTDLLAVVRSPPEDALYHRTRNDLYRRVLSALEAQQRVTTIVLARTPTQREEVRSLSLSRAVLPEQALDSRSLLWHADLVIGAGGTMTREAALLGAPTFTIFAGRSAAVDEWLIARARLRRLERIDDLPHLVGRERGAGLFTELTARGAAIAEQFADATLRAAG